MANSGESQGIETKQRQNEPVHEHLQELLKESVGNLSETETENVQELLGKYSDVFSKSEYDLFWVWVDASQSGVGALVTQENRPVAYASKHSLQLKPAILKARKR